MPRLLLWLRLLAGFRRFFWNLMRCLLVRRFRRLMTLTQNVRVGCQVPSSCHLPEPRGGTAGADAVALAEIAGLNLDPWQQWCLAESLAETDDFLWSAFEVAIVVSRQNGKGSILEARQLAGLFLLHERLQVHTAHEFKTGFEHFLRIKNLIEANPDFDSRVSKIRHGAGEQAIELKTGERLRFLARSSSSGRGLSGDVVYLDEAFALTPQMMGALLPTLSARPNPQLWYTSSAPMSTSGVLHRIVERGRSDDSGKMFFAEWANPEGVDVQDVDAWYKANPALGIRISEEFVRSELDALGDLSNEFARERLGVPDPLPAVDAKAVKIPEFKWAQTLTNTPPVLGEGEITISFDVTFGNQYASIAIASGSIGAPYVEVIEHREGLGWLPARLVALVERWKPTAVGCNGAGPTGAAVGPVLAAFRDAGISADLLHQVNTVDYKQACGGFFADVIEGRLRRPANQGPLDVAAADAAERQLGDSWVWDLRSSVVPISPLVAVTIARSLLRVDAVSTPQVFAY